MNATVTITPTIAPTMIETGVAWCVFTPSSDAAAVVRQIVVVAAVVMTAVMGSPEVSVTVVVQGLPV